MRKFWRPSEPAMRKVKRLLKLCDGQSKYVCLLYTSDAADERSSVDLGGRRIIKNKNQTDRRGVRAITDRYSELGME